MKVKICGITDLEAALAAIEFGADALGFVFAESTRRITPEKAKEIIHYLPLETLKVGVFVNERKERIEEIIIETGINIIQLHGDESPSFCREFTIPVIKSFSINTAEDLAKIEDFKCEYILLDSPKGKYRGGNGVAFDWTLLSELTFKKRIVLAGGLNCENVIHGIQQVNPYMVDVSSGVETNGEKDLNKIENFIKKAKQNGKGG